MLLGPESYASVNRSPDNIVVAYDQGVNGLRQTLTTRLHPRSISFPVTHACMRTKPQAVHQLSEVQLKKNVTLRQN